MAASKEWTEWHLTPQGWQRGSEKTDFAPATKVQPPEDRVLTCVFRETIASSFGGFSGETGITWSSDDEQKITSLRQQFGDCPERL